MFSFKDEKQKILVLAVIGLIVLIVYFQFLLKPQITSLVSVSSQVTQTFKKLNQAKKDIANVSKFKEKIEKLKEEISFYEKNMPTQKEIPALLGELSKFAKETNVKILAILPLEKTEEAKEKERAEKASGKEPYFEVPISIEARAKYHNLGFFINKLETAGRFMKVSDIKIQTNPATPMLHNVQLIVSAYCLPESKKEEDK